jgi:hypothetical protein
VIAIILRTCFNCDTKWYSSDNSKAWICGKCGTVILHSYSHIKISNKPNWKNILLYCEDTVCNEDVENFSESKFSQAGHGKTTRLKNRDCDIGNRSGSVLLTYSQSMIK